MSRETLDAVIDTLPIAEREKFWDEYTTWYNALKARYAREFKLKEGDSTLREFSDSSEVRKFFRTAAAFWEDHTPETITDVLTAAQMRTCHAQITELEHRLRAVNLPDDDYDLEDDVKENPEDNTTEGC